MPKVWYHEKDFDYYELVDATDEELKEQFESTGGFFNQTLEDYIANYRKWEAKKLKRLEERAQKAREEVLKQPVSQQETQPERKSHFSTSKSVPKDVSADKRQELYNAIVNKENDIDDLQKMREKGQERNEQFIYEFSQKVDTFEESFYQSLQLTSRQSQRQQAMVQEVYSHLKTATGEQNEMLESACRKTKSGIEKEIETLHKERNALPW